MAEADKALYRAKAEGKDRLVAAPLLDAALPLDHTLVQQNEKRFLFSSLFTDTAERGGDS